MKIAVNTRFMFSGALEGFGVYTHEIMSRMCRDHPEDSFAFYFDRSFDPRYVYGSNVHARKLLPPARHPILFRVWYDFVLKNRLKKDAPDVFFSPDSFMPLKPSVPTVITVHDVAHRQYPGHVPRAIARYFDTFMPLYIARADRIITVSEFSKQEILKWYPGTDEGKISVIHRPFLLYLGAIHPRKNIANLIAAYDIFRSGTGESIPLLLAGRKSWQLEAVETAYTNSPFKEDIVFTGYVPDAEMPGLIGAALAFCYVSRYEGFGLPIIDAMASGVPVVCSNTGALAEVASDAAITVDPEDPEEIARGIRVAAMDTEMRAALTRKGIARAGDFNWQEASELTYDILRSL